MNLLMRIETQLENMVQILFPSLSQASKTQSKLAWLVLFRWLSLVLQSIVVGGAHFLQFISSGVFLIFGVILFGLGLLNGIYALELSLTQDSLNEKPVKLLLVLTVDLMAFIYMLSLTQGIHNPFFAILYIYVVLASLLLPYRLSLIFLSLLFLAVYSLQPVVYLLDAYGTYVRLAALHSLLIQGAVIFGIWGAISTLNQRLEEYKERWQALKDKEHRLQRVKLLEALGAGFSHEFATPLNTVRMRLERAHSQGQNHDLEVALQALSQCEDALTSMARLPGAQHLQRLQDLPVEKEITNLVKHWQANDSLRTGSLELPVLIRSELPTDFIMPLPAKLLEQALINLLNNALQASELGPIEISVFMRLCDGSFILEIADQGKGWPQNVRTHLGEPFISTRKEGTGLGLYTVYVMVEALGGTLELLDNHPKGAVAKICLPLKHLN